MHQFLGCIIVCSIALVALTVGAVLAAIVPDPVKE